MLTTVLRGSQSEVRYASHNQMPKLLRNTNDAFIGLIQTIANRLGIQATVVDDDVIRLDKNAIVKFIKGRTFPLNSSSSAATCKDKAACSDLLEKANIAQIRHHLFLNPGLGDWTPPGGSWPLMHEFARKEGYNVVCKPKDEGGGLGVEHVNSGRSLEQAVERIFSRGKDVVLCAFKAYKYEYRVLVYHHQVEVILRKSLPKVVGDGEKNLAQLIQSYLETIDNPEKRQEIATNLSSDLKFSQEIPPKGTAVLLDWKHNGKGATSEIISSRRFPEFSSTANLDPNQLKKISNLALQAVGALDLCFGAVDIIQLEEDPQGRKYCVLEVNSAPMLDHTVEAHRGLSEEIETKIYTDIIQELFSSSLPPQTAMLVPLRLRSDMALIPAQPLERKVHKVADLIADIATTNGWAYSAHSLGWINVLTKEKQVRIVYGYTWPLNNSASARICKNKLNASAVMRAAGVPQIDHERVKLSLLSSDGVLSQVSKLVEKYSFPLVCKQAEGSGGVSVELARTPQELDIAIFKCFKNNQEITICKYEKFLYEYRIIMLEHQAEVIFSKEPPFVVGDGEKTLEVLMRPFLQNMPSGQRQKLLQHVDLTSLDLNHQPSLGEKIYLHWKHNLGQGATCNLLGGRSYHAISQQELRDEDDPFLAKLIGIARQATRALDVRFASIDIAQIETSDGSEDLRVVEANAGIMMDSLMEQYGEKGVGLAKRVFTKALSISFNERG